MKRWVVKRWVWPPVFLALLAAGCATPDTSVAAKATPTPTATVTEAPVVPAPATPAPTEEPAALPVFAQRGLLAVGVTTLAVGDRKAEVWYPAQAEAVAGAASDLFDPGEELPESPSEELPAVIETGTFRDVAAAESGPYPVVVFSHASPSYRQQSTNLLAHLASWGFVVMSMDHLDTDVSPPADDSEEPEAVDEDADIETRDELDVANALNQLEAANETPGGLLESAVDMGRLAVSGQSAGSSTAWRLAQLDAVDAVIAISTSEPLEVSGDVDGLQEVTTDGLAPGVYLIEITAVDDDVTLTFEDETQVLPIDDLLLSPAGGGEIRIVADPDVLTTGTLRLDLRLGNKPALVISGTRDVIAPPERGAAVFAVAGVPKRLVSIDGAGHGSFTDSCIEARDGDCSPDLVDSGAAQAMAAHFMVAHLFDVFEVADVAGAFDPAAVDLIAGVELQDFQSFSE